MKENNKKHIAIVVVGTMIAPYMSLFNIYESSATQVKNQAIQQSTNEIIVKYKDDLKMNAMSNSLNDKIVDKESKLKIATIEIGRRDDLNKELKKYNSNSNVLYAEPNYAYKSLATPNDPYLNSQWGIANSKTDLAWDSANGNSKVFIAVIDSGVQVTHPDLSQSIVSGYNTVDENTNVFDDIGHGTHVAGIAAAVKNNGIGVAGVASGASILPIRAMTNGMGYTSDIIEGIRWSADNYKIKGGEKLVINMSLGGPGYSQAFQDAINYAVSKGAIVIASAGNSGANQVMYPAGYDNVISVANITSNDVKAPSSTYGSHIDVSAPGSSIYSTVPGGYGYMTGTSMSAPFVSGQAALIWSYRPTLTNLELEKIIKLSARDIGAVGFDIYTGYGTIDVKSALTKQIDNSTLGLTITKVNRKKISTRLPAQITYSIAQGSKVTAKIYNSNNALVKTLVNGTYLSAGTKSLSWDARDSFVKAVPDGEYNLEIMATDIGGTVSSTKLIETFTVDNTAPTVSSLTASPNIFEPTGINYVNFNYQLSENSKVTSGVYSERGSLIKQTELNVLKNGGNNIINWNGKNSSNIIVPDGKYKIVIKAIDEVNNTSSIYEYSFIVEAKIPTISNNKITYPLFRPTGTNLNTISFSLTENCNTTVKIYKPTSYELVKTVFDGTVLMGSKSVTWNGKDNAGLIVPDGTYLYEIDAVDMLGKSAQKITGTITVDTTAPAFSEYSVSSNSFVPTGSNYVVFGYTLSEKARVTTKIYNSLNYTIATLESTPKDPGSHAAVWFGKNSYGSLLKTGTYKFTIVATDAAGNSKTLNSEYIRIGE